MSMNNSETKLKELIHVERGIIPSYICDHVVDSLEKNEWDKWHPHYWYDNISKSYNSEETMELDIQNGKKEYQDLLSEFIIQAGKKYNTKYSFPGKKTEQIIHKFRSIRFNRYMPGQIMRQHHDHIHSLFDGKEKGIPVLSFILNLNDDYEGAELFFWDDEIIPLSKGDIVIFPSLFLFPHGVKEATKGKRYSAVSWAW